MATLKLYELGLEPRQIATLVLTLEYRKENMIRNISEYRRDIEKEKNLHTIESLETQVKFFEETIEDIDLLIKKMNLR